MMTKMQKDTFAWLIFPVNFQIETNSLDKFTDKPVRIDPLVGKINGAAVIIDRDIYESTGGALVEGFSSIELDAKHWSYDSDNKTVSIKKDAFLIAHEKNPNVLYDESKISVVFYKDTRSDGRRFRCVECGELARDGCDCNMPTSPVIKTNETHDTI